MKHLLIGAAAVALAASSAFASPGNGKGNGGGNAKEAAGASMKAGGNGRADKGPAMKPDRGPSMQAASGPAMKDNRGQATKAPAVKNDRGPAMKADKGPPQQAAKPDNRGNGNGNGNVKANVARDDRGNDRTVVRGRDADRPGVRILEDGRRVYATRDARDWWGDYDQRGLIDGCPPGLAKKNNGCMPPGLAKARDNDYRYRYATYRPDWWGLSALGLGSGNYFYDSGYLLRYSGNDIIGYVPLLGGALAAGNPWPSYYAPRPVPQYYVDYYNLGPQNGYRYADNVLYRVDPQTSAITSIAALLTGDDIQVGSPMPMGYDVYNVPYPYRSQYADGPQANYRYSDGYVYQVDPETRLVAAAIELLAT